MFGMFLPNLSILLLMVATQLLPLTSAMDQNAYRKWQSSQREKISSSTNEPVKGFRGQYKHFVINQEMLDRFVKAGLNKKVEAPANWVRPSYGHPGGIKVGDVVKTQQDLDNEVVGNPDEPEMNYVPYPDQDAPAYPISNLYNKEAEQPSEETDAVDIF